MKEIHEEMVKDNASFNDVMTKSVFVRDQRTIVENVVKLLDERFEAIYNKPATSYDCRLLDTLKQEDATPSCTAEGLLQLSDYEDRLKKQIKAEIDGQVVVENISRRKITNHNVKFYVSRGRREGGRESTQLVTPFFHLSQRNTLVSIEKKWEKDALSAFKRHLEALRNREKFGKSIKMVQFPYLAVLKPEDYVSIIIREIKKLGMGSEMYSLPFHSLCRAIGNQVFKMYEVMIFITLNFYYHCTQVR